MADVTGPISTLPGSRHALPVGATCDDHAFVISSRIADEYRRKGGTDAWWGDSELKQQYDAEMAQHPATRRIQGETDSFGSEMIDLCEECYIKFREECAKERDRGGVCDWCKKSSPLLTTTRDADEGMYGPVYRVCVACFDRQNDALREELEYWENHRHGDRW